MILRLPIPPFVSDALCARKGEANPDAFFPKKGDSGREAKKVCARCLVSDECAQYALDRDERHGIWGGLTERERRRLKKRPAA